MNINLTDEQVKSLLKNASADTLRKILEYVIEYHDSNYDPVAANIVAALIAMPSGKLTPELVEAARKYTGGNLADDEDINYLSYNPIVNAVKYEIVDKNTGDVKFTSIVRL